MVTFETAMLYINYVVNFAVKFKAYLLNYINKYHWKWQSKKFSDLREIISGNHYRSMSYDK